ncbi:hypothetical protein SPI_05516 [Niveomyces insectorum RCEF 264]|uniref:Uncharacterized protein n=1 Tax=Niveomyces insectorum RCEF 264 TaxID=1081102 RepID=A0A167TAK1_9HYPO|nr:hypothetical protein SPI_05516 [Niveomyces insectorum RCEF 264]
MATPSRPFVAALALLAVDGLIELGFISSMVAYLHAGAPSRAFTVRAPHDNPAAAAAAGVVDNTYQLQGKPAQFLLNQGHTSNGAAGTAVVLVAAVGSLLLVARRYLVADGRRSSLVATTARVLYTIWVALQVPALLLTLGALAYVFAVTRAHAGQTIDQTVAAGLAPGAAYPLDAWTPQNWFAAVLGQLDLAAPAGIRADLARHLRIMRGWQYNLIPLFVVQLAETVLALMDYGRWRQQQQQQQQQRQQWANGGSGHSANEAKYSPAGGSPVGTYDHSYNNTYGNTYNDPATQYAQQQLPLNSSHV